MKKLDALWVVVIAGLLLAQTIPAGSAQFNFTPRLTVKEEYNDNILLERKNEKDDFITTVSPGVAAELRGQTSGALLDYNPSYSFFMDNDQYDGWQHRAMLSAWNEFSRETRLELFNYFLYAKDPLADNDVVSEKGDVLAEGDPTRRRNRDTYYRDIATARLQHQLGAENFVFGQFVYGLLKNDDPLDEDSQEFSPSVGAVYWFTQWTGIETDFGYTRGLYDDTSSDFHQGQGRLRLNQRISPRFGLYGEYKHIVRNFDDSPVGGDENDYMVYAPSAGVFYDFDRTLRASFGVGYYYQQIEDQDDEQGPFFNSEVNKLWDFQRWSIRARGASGIDSQDFGAENRGFERFAQLELSGRYDFTRQLFADAAVRYRYADYINSDDDIVDHRYGAEVGVGYDIFRWMRLRLSYAFNKLDSQNTLDDYEENRVMLQITLQPDQPYRW
jgi:predicted porin